jgi:hypothetical protein
MDEIFNADRERIGNLPQNQQGRIARALLEIRQIAL